jgi:hypothetical protein
MYVQAQHGHVLTAREARTRCVSGAACARRTRAPPLLLVGVPRCAPRDQQQQRQLQQEQIDLPSANDSNESGSDYSTQRGKAGLQLALQDSDLGAGERLNCVETGMGVSCYVAADEQPAPGSNGSDAVGSQTPTASTTATAPPAAAAEAGAGSGVLQQLLGTALLVSPFFFWGTSMVAMKARMPLLRLGLSTSPLTASSWLSLPPL